LFYNFVARHGISVRTSLGVSCQSILLSAAVLTSCCTLAGPAAALQLRFAGCLAVTLDPSSGWPITLDPCFSLVALVRSRIGGSTPGVGGLSPLHFTVTGN